MVQFILRFRSRSRDRRPIFKRRKWPTSSRSCGCRRT